MPFAPAGPTDIAARLIATKLTDTLKQQFYVENVAGAGGNIGMGQAAKAAPDGYTILFVSSSYVVNPSLYDKVPYDPYKDFRPLTVAATAANVLLVNPKVLPVEIAQGARRPRQGQPRQVHLRVGRHRHHAASCRASCSSSPSSSTPCTCRSAAPARRSSRSSRGHTPLAFTSLPPAVPHIKAGTLRALAVANKTRVAVLPEVPTLAEAGIPDQEADTFQAVLVPAGVPKEIADFIYREVVKATKAPDVTAKMEQLGLEIICNTPEQFAEQIKDEIAKWGKVIKDAKIKQSN